MTEEHYLDGVWESMNGSERQMVLEAAYKWLRKKPVRLFTNTHDFKVTLTLIERIECALEGRGYGTGYVCDIYECDKPAFYYNSRIDAFYCKEHN